MLAFASLFTVKAATVDPAGLTLHYRFDGNTNNAVAGIYGAATLVNNAILTTGGGGFSGEALDLTATTGGGADVDHALLPANFTVGVTDFTAAAWVKVTEDGRGWSRIFDFGNGTDNYMFITAYLDGHIRFVIKNQANGEQVIEGTALAVNDWTHVAVTVAYTAGIGVGKLYVNGVCVGTKTDITNTLDGMGAATANNYIGRSQYNDWGFKGFIDDFCFYTRALSPLEVKTLALQEGEALVEGYPFSGSSAEVKNYPVTTKFVMDGWANFALYDNATGFVLDATHHSLTTNWTILPLNDALRMTVFYKRNYSGFAGDPDEIIYSEQWVAIPWAGGNDEKIGLISSSTRDLRVYGDIRDLLTAHPDATITVTKVTLNNFGRSNVVYQLTSANVGGNDVTSIGLDGDKPYSGEFTATEKGRQAFWINRFAIPEEFVGKYVRLDLSESTSDNWGFNLAFEDKLNANVDGWADLNNPTVKIGNSYYYQIPSTAATINPQLWKNSNGDTKTIKVAGFFLTDKINIVLDEDTEFIGNASFGYVTVNAGKKLTVASGVTFTAEELILKSDAANGTATFVDNGTSTITSAKVEQFLAGKTGASSREWWYVSSPVNGAKTTLFNTNGNRIGYYTEATASYTAPITAEENLATGRGYVLSLAGDDAVYTFSGALNNGAVNIPVSRTGSTAAKRGFNLVGNPYPSYLDWDAVISQNVQSTIWTRTFEADQMVFKTYNADAQVGSDDQTTAHIAPLQAFWVKVPSEKVDVSGLTLDLTNAMRLHKEVSDAGLRASKAESRQLLRLAVSNGTNTDNAVIVFDENAQDTFDSYDSEKMSNDNAAIPEIYTLAGGERLVINSMRAIPPSSEEITLGFRTGATGSFTIQATAVKNMDSNLQIILKDKLTDTNFDLTDGDAYSFTSDVANTENRFSITFASKTYTEIKTAVNHNQCAVYSGAGSIRVKVLEPLKVSVYNTLGQCRFVSGSSVQNEITIALSAGIYFVKAGNDVVKVIIK